MSGPNQYKPISKTQYVIAVLWPSFLVAGLETVLFFTLVDPIELAQAIGRDGMTRIGSYSIGFFCFWIATTISSSLTQYFQRPCELINAKEQLQ